jgi:hypothetical protein
MSHYCGNLLAPAFEHRDDEMPYERGSNALERPHSIGQCFESAGSSRVKPLASSY